MDRALAHTLEHNKRESDHRLDTQIKFDMPEKIKLPQMLWLVLLVFCCCLPLYYFLLDQHFQLPMAHGGDAGDHLWTWLMLKGFLHGGGPYIGELLPNTNAPYGAVVMSLGFPIPEQFQLMILWLLTKVLVDPITAYDAYYLLGYPLAAIAFYVSALRLKIEAPIAFGLSFSFAYITYHQSRYGHLLLSHYWVMAPAVVFIAISWSWEFNSKKQLVAIMAAAFLITVWHSYFGYFFIAVSGLLLLIRITDKLYAKQTIRYLTTAGVLLSFGFFLALGISTAHTFAARSGKTDLPAQIKRHPDEAGLYRLRPRSVLLPRDDHRMGFSDTWRQHYYSQTKHRIEGLNESIGILAALGVIGGLGVLAARLFRRQNLNQISILGLMSAVIFFFGSGLSVLIGYWIPIFRSNNRIGPMLAVCGLLVTGIGLSHAVGRLQNYRFLITGICGIAVAFFAVWDQVPHLHPNYADDTLKKNQQFVDAIERAIPSGNVLQLPAMEFPEPSPIEKMESYAHFTGPLFAKSVQYSYGTWKGTKQFEEIGRLSLTPLDLKKIRNTGFNGIWIDRLGYADSGNSLISDLKAKLGFTSMIQSGDGRRVFFKIL
jgi:phosphoglycerol transferase